MATTLDVYYTVTSPWSFLAWDRLGELVERSGVSARYHPIDYGLVFARTGGLPLAKRPPERRRYRLMELERWTKRLGVPLNLEPRFFPVDDGPAAGLVLAARAAGLDVWRLSRAFMAAVWQEQRDIADAATREAILEEQGFDAGPLLAAAPAMAELRLQESAAAVERGVFGAPFFITGETHLWGQDRLDFLAEALAV